MRLRPPVAVLALAWLPMTACAAAHAGSAPVASTTESSNPVPDFASPTLGVMKWIPAGTFTMGSPEGVGPYQEHPQHRVTLTRGYWMMEHEVTQGEWAAVMGTNPSKFQRCGATCPVEQVSWDDAVSFAEKASSRDGVEYRLPTEAEWERAARGGRDGEMYAGGNELDAVGWSVGNSGGTTHPVCEKGRNGYGLCDMTGNVWEWVADLYDADSYGTLATDPILDPYNETIGSYRIYRGCSFGDSGEYARVSRRYDYPGDGANYLLGVRLLKSSLP